ncbi:MAG TPA: response regulator transcription factor [Anaerolineales bacterium]|nr:response regulator transcription factor [Anaerolineales bacterium]
MTNILVIDDEANIVRLVRDYLEEAGYHVLTASNAETGLHTLRRETPDLLVLDLGLPDRDGWDLTRQIRSDRQMANIPIIMLTARVEDSDRIIGLELGADDYITKPFNPREVVARVRAVLRRTSVAKSTFSRRISITDLTLDLGEHTLTIRGEQIELTPTEFELLSLFMENPGHTYTREELLEKTLGYSYEGTGRTLDSHISNLRHKIEPDPTEPTYIQTVHRIGYRFVKNPEDET